MYKLRIAIDPDVLRILQEKKREFGVQSHNKALRRLLGLNDVRIRKSGKGKNDDD